MAERAQHLDRLIEAIELIESNRNLEALEVLRALIREDNDFEEAWLWMSVAVDSADKSRICLDNVLRINPRNGMAQAALYRLREREMASETRRARLRTARDTSLILLWMLVIGLLFAILFSGAFSAMRAIDEAETGADPAGLTRQGHTALSHDPLPFLALYPAQELT